MKITYCDRCEEELPDEHEGIRLKVEFTRDRIMQWNGYPLPRGMRDEFRESQILDLCPNCAEGFAKYILSPDENVCFNDMSGLVDENGHSWFECSKCGIRTSLYQDDISEVNFCPNCGARVTIHD